jgi:hypothetical protein
VALLLIIVTIGGVALSHAVVCWFIPRLTRPDLYFAVTVAPGFRNDREGESILRRYRVELVLVSAAAFTAAVAGVLRVGVRFVPGGYFLLLTSTLIPFYRARQRVLPHAVLPTTIREAALGDGDRTVPGGWVAACGPFLLLAACGVYLWTHAEHTRAQVYVPSTVGMLAALSLMLYGLSRWVRPIQVIGPEAARELTFRRTMSRILLAIEYFIVLQSSLVALIGSRHAAMPPVGVVIVLPVFLVLSVAAIVALVRLGQGGSAMSASHESSLATSGPPTGDRTRDTYWKLGIIYFNRDDPAVVVEKRFGLGYTLNFARPAAWVIVLLLVVGAMVPVVAPRLLR